MDQLIIKRKSLQLQVGTLKTLVDNHAVNPLTETEVKIHLEKVGKLRIINDDIHNQILSFCANDADICNQTLEFEKSEELLIKMKIALMDIEKTFATAAPRPPSSTASEVRLPKLELPSFNGDIHQWLSFHDLFVASVHRSNRLSGGQKLQYLKASVKGEPANLIQSIEITDANFDEAWQKLKNRYQNTREIIKSHFERLLSQPNIQQENPVALRKLVDTTNECVRAFEILKITPQQVYELIVIHLISKKLDAESRLQWERSLKDDEIPKFCDFTNFLDRHARVTAAAGTAKPKTTSAKSNSVNHNDKNPYSATAKTTAVHIGTSKPCCVMCSGEHFLFQCADFIKKSVSDRHTFVKSKKLCFNCLRAGHSATDCSSKYKCKECKSAHHTLLHLIRDSTVTTTTTEPQPPQQPPQQQSSAQLFASKKIGVSQVLLSTAIIKVKDVYGNEQLCRALLDNGSMSSIVTENLVQRLKLKRERVDIPLSGLGNSSVGSATNFVQLNISSCVKQFNANLNALILPKITGTLPHSKIDISTWTHISCLKLADPKFFQPEEIDLLLGNDICTELMCTGKINGPTGTPTAMETELGWILGGKVQTCPVLSLPSLHLSFCSTDSILQKFWELEEVPRKKFLTPEEEQCEKHFEETHSRNSTGRYVVKLPFKSTTKQLGNSRDSAVRRLKQVERRLENNPAQRKLYSDVINEYLELNHMEKIPPEEINKSETNIYCMPHHAVIKESSSTTKLRVVFDASCKSTTGVSLNDNLLVGPRLQDDLMNILIRFRTYPIAITADITKMYRQFLVHPDDVNYQRIVWRNSPDEPIRDYRLLTATFGTASAPYLAVKCVQQLAKDSSEEFPKASSSLLRDLYVDDLMSGANSIQDAKQLQLLKIMERGQLELRKWSSNCPALLETLPPELRESNSPLSIDEDESVKTLGLQWHPAQDCFKFKLQSSEPRQSTKRAIASEIAKNCFDPLGWLSPVTIQAKFILKDLWRRNLDWDELLPEDLLQQWLNYLEDLPALENISISRCITKSMCDLATEFAPKESTPSDSKSHPPLYTLLGYSDADCASRGISPTDLKDHHWWWNGFTENSTLATEILFTSEDLTEAIKEERKSIVIVHHTAMDRSFIQKYSSLNKLQRVTAYILRFVHDFNPKNRSTKLTGHLTVNELQNALLQLVKAVQHEEFYEETNCLIKKKPIPQKIKILALNPFLDSSGILRVGGRLKKSSLPIDKKYPMLLPEKNYFTTIIISHYHRVLLHAGPQVLLATLQEQFWILGGRDVIQHFIRKCIVCFRLRAECAKQMMGDLPTARVNPGRPFKKCGVDYAGPFTLRVSKGKGTRKSPVQHVKTSEGEFLRPIVKLCTLPIHD